MCNDLIGSMKKEFPRRVPTQENLYDYFISRARNNLHTVLCFSPVGQKFRNRSLKFPGLISGCTMDWFERSVKVSTSIMDSSVSRSWVKAYSDGPCVTYDKSLGTNSQSVESSNHWQLADHSWLPHWNKALMAHTVLPSQVAPWCTHRRIKPLPIQWEHHRLIGMQTRAHSNDGLGAWWDRHHMQWLLPGERCHDGYNCRDCRLFKGTKYHHQNII